MVRKLYPSSLKRDWRAVTVSYNLTNVSGRDALINCVLNDLI